MKNVVNQISKELWGMESSKAKYKGINKVGGLIRNQVSNEVINQVNDEVWDQVNNKLRNHVVNQVKRNIKL